MASCASSASTRAASACTVAGVCADAAASPQSAAPKTIAVSVRIIAPLLQGGLKTARYVRSVLPEREIESPVERELWRAPCPE